MTMAETGTPPASAAELDRVAARALALCAGARVIGLGSGRAATAFIRALGAEVKAGRSVRGVPTSEATARLARELGIPLAGLDEASPELTVDGADEVDPRLDLIKGYGGALTRERIVAAASRRQVILVTSEKLVPRLGARGRLPVEIVPFARPLCDRRLTALGCRPRLREAGSGPFVTDNGNWILDCEIAAQDAAAALDREIRRIPGVVDTGFFLGTADRVLVAEAGTVRVLRRAGDPGDA
jgi:ribose 5-phosphate isomerase A